MKEGRRSSSLGKKRGRSGLKQTSKCVSAEVYVRRGIGRGDLPSSGRLWSWCNFDELLKAQVLRSRPACGRVHVLASWIHGGVLCFDDFEKLVSCQTLFVLRHTQAMVLCQGIQVLVQHTILFNSFLSCYQMHQRCIMWVYSVFGAQVPTLRSGLGLPLS